MKRISVLGSTGSIGTQTLSVARHLSLEVKALAAYRNITLLEEQIREFKPELVCVVQEDAARDLKTRVADLPVRVETGLEGLCECAAYENADVTLNAVVGMIGLQPTLAAIRAGKTVALANKETLVAGGHIVMPEAEKYGVSIFPVDSEHSAIFQSLQGCPSHGAVKKLILTASGGPFYGKKRSDLESISPAAALRHPNWSMGPKITVDSATMMNKGLELMEAAWLFDMPEENIDVLVHRESIVHSMVEYCDNAVIAQLGVPDMRIPIQYALTYPERMPCEVESLDLAKCASLSFAKPDEETFPGVGVCRRAMRMGGVTPAIVNGANEEAVSLFLNGKIGFLDISALVSRAMEQKACFNGDALEDVLAADKYAREFVRGFAE